MRAQNRSGGGSLAAGEITSTSAGGTLTTASSGDTYIERSWNGSEAIPQTKAIDDAIPAVPADGKMTSGWYYLDKNITVKSRVSLAGDTNLILLDGYTLDVKGLYIPKGSTLTIYAQSDGDTAGKIYSHPDDGAAIGAYAGHKGGNIVIHGGRIQAAGAKNCAAIGANDDDRPRIPKRSPSRRARRR